VFNPIPIVLATTELDAATTKAIAERICEQYEADGYDHMREWCGEYIIEEAIPDFLSGFVAEAARRMMERGCEDCCDGWHERDVWRKVDTAIKWRYQEREACEGRLRRR
jgi:hypothetical protein